MNEVLGCGGSSGNSGGGADIESLAWAVINGDYGNGEERRQRLEANYDAVQRRVNEILSRPARNCGNRLPGDWPCWLLCLALLPFYPLAWLAWKLDDLRR